MPARNERVAARKNKREDNYKNLEKVRKEHDTKQGL